MNSYIPDRGVMDGRQLEIQEIFISTAHVRDDVMGYVPPIESLPTTLLIPEKNRFITSTWKFNK